MKHIARRLADAAVALVSVAVLLVGLPVGLAITVGWPLPTAVPTIDEIQLALRSGIDPQLLINFLAIVVWVVWVQLVVAMAVETVAVARRATPLRLPVLPGLQHAAGRLVAAIALTAATIAPLKAPPAVAAAPLTAIVSAAEFHFGPADVRSNQPALLVRHEAQTPHRHYTTQRFDTLWGIAEATMGDGRRWHEIRTLNPDHAATDGRIRPGVQLTLPSDATVPSDQPPLEVTVEKGDHFWSIAQTALADRWGRTPTTSEVASYWQEVIEVNRDQLVLPHNPNLIHPGQVLQIPPPPVNPDNRPEADPDATVTVEAGDSLWGITRDALTEELGRTPTDPEVSDYLRAVVDHNRDRLSPPYDPDLIYPGQTFQVPSVTSPRQPAEPEGDANSEPLDPAGQPAPTAPPIDQPLANRSEPVPSTAPPPAPATTPVTSAPTRPSIADVPASSIDQLLQDSTGEEPIPDINDEAAGGLLPTPAKIAGLGILAAGLVALIDRLRRIQLQHRRPATIPTPPPDTAEPVEVTLRSAAAPTAIELMDTALRALGRHILDANAPFPEVVGVHLSDQHLRVLLWSPNEHPPDGWRTEDDANSWVLPTSADLGNLASLADKTAAPYPTLITAGHDADSQLLLDLEFIGALRVSGTPTDVAATCYTIATELAASTLADDLEVICVGFGHDLAQLERVRVVDHLDTKLLDQLDARTAAVDQHPAESPIEGRMSPGGDTWYPVIVIDPATSPPEGADRLLTSALSGRAVTAVVGYPTGDRWCLHVDGDTARIDPLGRSLSRRNLTPTEQEEVTHLITAAKDLNGVANGHPPVFLADYEPHSLYGHVTTNGDGAEQVTPIVAANTTPDVRVLGSVAVAGTSFRSRKSTELCVYLVLHPNGVEADRLMEALWPAEAPDLERLNRTTSEARLALGELADSTLYLPRVTGGIYRVAHDLGCDLTRFQEHVERAKRTDGDDTIRHLTAALELVSGRPFSGTSNGYAWVSAESLYSFSVVAVDDTAHRLSELALDQGTPELSAWAARQGLLAAPSCEHCYRNLMEVAIAQNNKVALEVIFGELVAAIEADDGPDAVSYLDPETIELYERHSRRHQGR